MLDTAPCGDCPDDSGVWPSSDQSVSAPTTMNGRNYGLWWGTRIKVPIGPRHDARDVGPIARPPDVRLDTLYMPQSSDASGLFDRKSPFLLTSVR